MSKRSFVAHGIRALAGAALLATIGNAANAKQFRSADVHPAEYPTVKAVEYMGKLISERTGGKHTIKVFGQSTLGSEKDTIEQTKLGALDMVRVNSAAFNNIAPETIIPALPFVFKSKEHMRAVLDGPVGEDILKALEPHGFVGLAFYDSGSRSFYLNKKPIKTPADMKGLKVRVQQSDMWVSMMQALGANPTPMPYAEVYTALKTGVVDGAENNWPSYESSKHFEVAKFYSLTEHSMAPEILVFSKKVWDTLADDEKEAIRLSAKQSVPYMRQLWDDREDASRKVVTDAGSTITPEVDKEAFVAAVKPVYEKFANTPALQDLVKRISETK
jgi:tripartite ATP-independent transporter DctP family solute receptor